MLCMRRHEKASYACEKIYIYIYHHKKHILQPGGLIVESIFQLSPLGMVDQGSCQGGATEVGSEARAPRDRD